MENPNRLAYKELFGKTGKISAWSYLPVNQELFSLLDNKFIYLGYTGSNQAGTNQSGTNQTGTSHTGTSQMGTNLSGTNQTGVNGIDQPRGDMSSSERARLLRRYLVNYKENLKENKLAPNSAYRVSQANLTEENKSFLREIILQNPESVACKTLLGPKGTRCYWSKVNISKTLLDMLNNKDNSNDQ